MSQSQRSKVTVLGSGQSVATMVAEFLSTLATVIWLTLVAVVKTFLPVSKKNVRSEVVLVTGAGSGIGKLMATRFAECGATVVLVDIDTQANERTCQEIQDKGQRAFAYTCDLSNKEQIYQTAAKIKQNVGSVTVLINNAGVITGKKFFECSDQKIDLTFRVNTTAHFWTIKAFVPDMISKNHGHIITIASGAGLFGMSGMMDYSASKFGAVGTHESLTMELYALGCTGVHTTCVCPFFIDTGMFDGVKTRIPWVLPILTAEYAVNKIMQAYHSNQCFLCMPRVMYLFYFLKSVLPVDAMLVAGKFFGITNQMLTFRGRPPIMRD